MKKLLASAVVALSFSTTAHAVPVTWSFNATYDDGVTAAGSYDFDADNTTFSNISITTSLGEFLAFVNPKSPGNSAFLNFVSTAGGTNGSANYTSELTSAMTNAGGTIDILKSFFLPGGTGFSFGGTCAGTPDCTQLGVSRRLVSGTVTTAPIPLPAALPMLLAALGGLGLMARRRQA